MRVLAVVLSFLAFLWSCSSDKRETFECITALDCADGFVCEDHRWVALPDHTAVVEKDVAVAEETAQDEESPAEDADKEESDEAILFTDEGSELSDDAVEEEDDSGAADEATDEDETPDTDFVEQQTEAAGDTLADTDVADADFGDEDLVDEQPDLDVDTYVDTTPPTVVATNPASDATDVGVGTLIEVTFSEAMKASTLTTSTIQMKQGTTPVVGTVSYTVGTYTAVFTPGAALAYDTTYTVTVTTGVQDEAGNALAEEYVFSFRTAIEEINECVTLGNPCDDQGDTAATCTDTLGGYTCSCSGGFTASGGTCQDVNECAIGNGGCAQVCNNAVGSYSCACISGYTLNVDGHSCDDINECVVNNNPCNDNGDAGGVCTNTDGGYTCTCSSGYTFLGGGCRNIDECLTLNNPCNDYGDPDALCADLPGSYTCTCYRAGYAFQNGACRDVNECLTNYGGCRTGGDTAATCTNTDGGYTCTCSFGWFFNGTTCDQSDECVGNPCDDQGDTGATCQDGIGTYSCTCSNGWEFTGGTCRDINECVTLNNPCDDQGDMGATCNNGTATYTCTCSLHYSWNFVTCVPDTRTYTCPAKPATGTVWNSVSSYQQTWAGSGWNPPDSATTYTTSPSTTSCRFKCLANYEWTGSACINSRVQACTGIPANAVYYNNTASYSITQTYSDANGWQPPTAAYYDDTPDVNTCGFKCNTNYTWNGSACAPATKTWTCSGAPANAVYYNGTSSYSYSQTWGGSDWVPPDSAAVYNAAPAVNTCQYKCAANFYWTGSACINSRVQSCSGAPANAVYYNGSSSYSITQTYTDANGWQPPATASYNASPAENTCQYKCAANYYWTGSACINSRTQACTGIPANAVYYNNTTSYSINQTYTDASGWQPPSTAYYDATPDENTCGFKCNTNYTWNGSICAADTRVVSCTGLPANAEWNTVSSITQTWNGSAWAPSSTGTYNTTPSTTECRFKCVSGHSWNGSACIAAYCGDGIAGNSTIPAFTETFESGVRPSYSSGTEWSIATDQKHSGTYSIKSNTVYWSGDTRSIYFVKYTDGQICFWHRSTSSVWYAEFRVYVDGSSKYSRTSSLTTWTETCVSTSAGYRMVEFRFSISDDMGDGNWYVDDIRFYNATTEQCDGGSTTCGNLGFDCGSAVSCGSDCTWAAGEAQCHDESGCGGC